MGLVESKNNDTAVKNHPTPIESIPGCTSKIEVAPNKHLYLYFVNITFHQL